jgi:hypothetical protein
MVFLVVLDQFARHLTTGASATIVLCLDPVSAAVAGAAGAGQGEMIESAIDTAGADKFTFAPKIQHGNQWLADN